MNVESSLSRRNFILGGAGSLALGTYGTGNTSSMDIQAEQSLAQGIPACSSTGGVNATSFSGHFDTYYNAIMGGPRANGSVYTERTSGLAVCLDQSNSFGFSNTAKTEGQGYGMMLAVMKGDKQKFYALWNYTSSKMRGSHGLFNWQTAFYDNDRVVGNGTAPDGEIWIITALLMAQKKWNDAGYGQAADQLLGVLKNNFYTYFNSNAVVRFVPNANYTDPSYANPAFFQFWDERRPGKGWGPLVNPHRQLLINATNANGLSPDFTEFNGSPHNGSTHSWDAYRVTMNQAFDRNWNGSTSHVTNVNKALATLNGNLSGKNSTQIGMYATAALTGVNPCDSRLTPYTYALLNNSIDTTYYAGLLCTIACGMLGGRFVK